MEGRREEGGKERMKDGREAVGGIETDKSRK